MSLPVIPENAPFSPAQRAWLNGFFAGVLGLKPGGQGASPDGSEVAAVAGHLASDSGELPSDEEFPWHDPALSLSERLELADGEPRPLRLMAAMAQLDCGACGYVCRTYSQAIADGSEADLTRCTPGGGDTAKAIKRLLAEAASEAPAGKRNDDTMPSLSVPSRAAPLTPLKPSTESIYTRARPFAARLVHSYRLNGLESAKDTRHVILDLTGSGIRYEPGDSLGVLPHNCPELIAGVLAALAATGEEQVVSPEGDRKSLRLSLATDYTLTRPSSALLKLLASRAVDPRDARSLNDLSESEADELLAGGDVCELLERYPSARLSIADLLPSLFRLQPRLYSISSSLKAHPDEVHLTVGVVQFESRGKTIRGVASNFLGVRCEPGDEIKVYVQPSRFRLPANPATPIIMIGPGTGIAPFRAFLQERNAAAAPGDNWLFFGGQHFAYDFLYRSEIDAYLDSGLLTRFDPAFSRDQAEKIYVQHRLLEHAREIWSWIDRGASIYVCGDAKRMAKDVDDALRQIVVEQGRRDPVEAKAYLQRLTRERRYQRDVY